MHEKMPTIKAETVPTRLKYGAVPLDPWNAKYPDGSGEPYVVKSLNHIDEVVQEAIKGAVAGGLIDTAESAAGLYWLMKDSLYDSQVYRIELNSATSPAPLLGLDDERVEWAMNGTATPGELLDLLMEYPQYIPSIEIGKRSHPFRQFATGEMDRAVYEALIQRGGKILPEDDTRYKMKRLHPEIPAGIVLQKLAISEHVTENGVVQVVRRKSFLVRGDPGASPDITLGRMIKNPDRFDELAEKINDYLPYAHILPESKWLQPQATSYYAKYLPEGEEVPKAVQ